ncbi:MAG: hypothetical protein WC764_04220 [Candidatus Paceibacterota bacterium]
MPIAKTLIGTGIAIASITGAILINPSDMKVCEATGCRKIEKADYTLLKRTLADKVKTDTPLQWSELEVLTAIIDFEARKNGKMKLGAVASREDIKNKIIQKLYEN